MTAKKDNHSGYDMHAAAQFWSRRLQSADLLSAVLTYNAPPELNRAYDKWERDSLQKLLPSGIKHKKALDIGCGIGRIAILLAKAGAHVTAVDISSDMLKTCRKKANKNKVLNRMQFVQSSAHQLSLPKEKFDIITCFGLLEHLPVRQRTACLNKALSLLKARGRLYVVVNNKKCIFLKSRYTTSTQNPDGYFVSMVGLNWVTLFCKRKNVRYAIKAANPFYAITHYYMFSQFESCSISEQEFKSICTQAVKLDLQCPLEDKITEQLASHYIIEIRL